MSSTIMHPALTTMSAVIGLALRGVAPDGASFPARINRVDPQAMTSAAPQKPIRNLHIDAHCANSPFARSRPAEALRRHGACGVVPDRGAGCARTPGDAVRKRGLGHFGSPARRMAAIAAARSEYPGRDRAAHADAGGGARHAEEFDVLHFHLDYWPFSMFSRQRSRS